MGSDEVVLRPGPDGAKLIRDLAYARAYTLRVGRTDQSYVDLDDPRRLEFDYLEQIAVVVDSCAPRGEAIRTVHIGGAAMSLARYVAATRPRSAQLVFEPDAELTAVTCRSRSGAESGCGPWTAGRAWLAFATATPI